MGKAVISLSTGLEDPEKVTAGSSPIHCHIGTVPPSVAPATSESSANPLALKQIGHTR